MGSYEGTFSCCLLCSKSRAKDLSHLGFSNDIKVELANCEYLAMLVRNQCLPSPPSPPPLRATTFASKLKSIEEEIF